jgi:hypothetical protein
MVQRDAEIDLRQHAQQQESQRFHVAAVVDRLGDRGVAREFGALCAHPGLKRGHQRSAPFLARSQTLGGK